MTERRLLLSGNEALARGAWEAGVRLAAGYPGTPSTEIIECLSSYPEVHAQWSSNEKVALEFAFGGSLGGARTLAAMKHVGLNVAADPFFTLAYSGVNGGLVVVSADDPWMHSSQNEQDNRNLGRAAKVPIFEPIDSQTTLDLIREAFSVSERFDTPVLFRTTTRICHAKSVVQVGEREERPLKPYRKQIEKYMMLPSVSRQRRQLMSIRLADLERYACESPFNRMQIRDPSIGILASGVAAEHAREIFPDASSLTLMISYPFPRQLVAEFARQVRRLVVVEELDPILEAEVRQMGLDCVGKDRLPEIGELRPEVIERCLTEPTTEPEAPESLPPRPPTLCAGCAHRPVMYLLHKLKCTVLGDIGCYSLGAYKPLDAMDTNLCMGASIGMAHGMEKALGHAGQKVKSVALLGDSTFIHSGVTGLIDVVYNSGATTTIILDNSTTAMTGHQEHAATGRTLGGREAPTLDFVELAKAIGVRRARRVDPNDLTATEAAIREELAADEPSLIVASAPCALTEYRKKVTPVVVIDDEVCPGCGICLMLGCPALIDFGNRRAAVDEDSCVGCNVCVQICQLDAMRLEERSGQ